jgi:NAD(P)-dependent dehydrogenase (short-subunit alcohol dehydrogenase family)
MEKRLIDKVAIVTGAASGIGKASALRLAQEGAIVVVNDINAPGADATAKQIATAGGRSNSHPCDVTSAEQVQRLVDDSVTKYGKLDILYNNAGGALPKPTHQTSAADWRTVIALNLDAVFYGVAAALPVMMRQKSGLILATSSGAGMNAVPELTAYGAAKAGVINLMRNIAVEYGAMGIRANAIAPGPMATPALLSWLGTLPGGADAFGRQVPSGRLGTPEDIAAAVAFLCTDEAAYINGAVLPVDGAIHALLSSPKPG